MNKATTVMAIAMFVALASQSASAQPQKNPTLVNIADVAGSTLLGPYFEVDLSNPTGMNTIFTVNNMGANISGVNPFPPPAFFTQTNGPTAVLAHLTIWSDLGVPVFNFNIYLTGFDVERIDMRAVLNGSLPQTASAGQDPQDRISPKGRDSQDINYASCSGGGVPLMVDNVNSYSQLPPGPISAATVANMQAALTGKPSASQGGKCGGADHSDNIARGYITIDTVNNCTARFPSDSGYLGAGGSGDTTDQTQLTGEVFYVDQLHGIARGDNLVHIHASPTDPAVTTTGNYTFYGRYDGFNAADDRQPLPTTFGARYVNGNFTGAAIPTPSSPAWGAPPANPPAGSTSLVVWRDSKVAQHYFTCGSLPSTYPLSQESVVAFDEQEHPQSTGAMGALTNFGSPFPIATQVVKIGGSALPVSFTAGWMYLNLNHTAAPGPASDTAEAQAWVEVIEQNGTQLFNIIHRAMAIDTGLAANHINPI